MSPARRIRRLTRIAAAAAAAHGVSRTEAWAAMRRARRHGYGLDEARILGLLDPAGDPGRFVAQTRLRPAQMRISPEPLSAVIDDKALFHRACTLAGLPVPETHAFVYRGHPGWARDGRPAPVGAEWNAALAELAPDEFIAKPVSGDYGDGVRLIENRGDVYAKLMAAPYDGFVVQTRARNHRWLLDLTGSDTLQTFRVVTIVERGEPSVVAAAHKVVLGDGIVDNFHGGATGNGTANVDVDTGALGPITVVRPDGHGLERLSQHPRTGRRYAGEVVPGWEALVREVLRAASAFATLGTVGWDVALTDQGPQFLEGNTGWATFNHVWETRSLLERLVAAARQPVVEGTMRD